MRRQPPKPESTKPLSPSESRGSRHLVIVGAGMVAHRLCQQLTKLGAATSFRITVLGEEPHPAYDRIRLSETPSPDIQALLLSPSNWYTNNQIKLRTGERVEALDPERKGVYLAGGEALAYDALVLATGSSPFLPPIDGLAGCPRASVFRSYADLEDLRRRAATAKRAVVIGGGLLGLETAKVLSDAGVQVHVVEASRYLMPRQLDAESARVLNERICRLGVQTSLGTQTRSIETRDDGVVLHFEGDSAPLAADFVVVAAGIRPRDELARQAGIEVGARGGVIVDEQLRTSAPDVYAVGECVSFRGERIGLVSPGYDMADVVATQLTGGRGRFRHVDRSCHLKLLGVPMAAAGLYDADANQLGVDVAEGRRTLLLDGRRLIGVTCVGEWPGLARVQDAVTRQMRLSPSQMERFRKHGELWPAQQALAVETWPESTILCNCASVTRGQLTDCIERGCRDVASLGDATGAGRTCGSCVSLLAQLCHAPAVNPPQSGRSTLMWSSLVAIALALLALLVAPIPFSQSVQPWLHQADQLFRDTQLKQWSGYSVIGIATLGGLLSLRKRTRLLKLGPFGTYRGLHALAGLIALFALVAHTGMRFGQNLNLVLMSVFVGLSLVGALAGVASALETAPSSRLSLRARKLRRPLTWAHLLLFWPLPILVGLHIFSVYYF